MAKKKDRQQFNMRVDGELSALISELLVLAAEHLGTKVNNSMLFRLALASLKREYLALKPKKGKS